MNRSIVLVLALLATACIQSGQITGPVDNALQEVDLQELVLEKGDLPEDFRAVETLFTAEEAPFDQLPAPLKALTLKIKGLNQDTSNLVSVLLYEDPSGTREAFERLVELIFEEKSQPLEGIGEAAQFQRDELAFHYISFDKIAFTRCRALVYIETSADTQGYARRLDERLKAAVCR